MRRLTVALAYALPLLFYAVTMAHTIGYGDTAIIVDNIERMVVDTHVNTHPLLVLSGQLFRFLPFGELALRANMVAVMFGALTVGTFFLVLLQEHGSRTKAAAGALLLMVCHSLWWHSTTVENYAISAFLVTLALREWRLLARSDGDLLPLYRLCAIAGLGLANHVQMGFLCVGVLVTGLLSAFRSPRPFGVVARCAGAALAGMSVFLGIFVHDWSRLGSLSTALNNAFFGNFQGIMLQGGFDKAVSGLALEFFVQSPTPYVLLGLAGIVLSIRRERLGAANTGMLTFLLLNTAFFSTYHTWDKFAFLLISFVVYHFYCAGALAALFDRVKWRPALVAAVLACAAFPPWLFGNLATWGRDPSTMWSKRYGNAYSANLYFQSEFIANPNKFGYDEMDRYADALFAKLPQDALYLDDDSRSYYQVSDYYQRYLHRRPDVTPILVNSWGMNDWGFSADEVSRALTSAYALNRPFFVVSTAWPMAGFIAHARKKLPIEFERFPLSDDRWIYRLRTASETATSPLSTARLGELLGFEPLELHGATGYVDVAPENVLYTALGRVSKQSMKDFPGDYWQAKDQLFFEARGKGAALEIGVEAEAATVVDLTLQLTTAPDYGDVSIELLPGGQRVTASLYEPGLAARQVKLGPATLHAGLNRLRLRVEGKAAASTGYLVGVDGLTFRRYETAHPEGVSLAVNVTPKPNAGGSAKPKSSARLAEPLAVELHFAEPAASLVPYAVRWFDPAGKLVYESPDRFAPVGATSVTDTAPAWPYPLPAGAWRVEARALDRPLAEARFQL